MEKLIQHPDAERAMATINHLDEGMDEFVSREDAIEAAAFYSQKYNLLYGKFIEVLHDLTLNIAEKIIEVAKDGGK